MLRLSALGLWRDPHGSVKQNHHEELEDGDKERPSAFPKIMLKQTDSGIQQLHGAGDRTQDQQRRRRLLVRSHAQRLSTRSVPTVWPEWLSVTICRAEAKISAQVNSIVGSG